MKQIGIWTDWNASHDEHQLIIDQIGEGIAPVQAEFKIFEALHQALASPPDLLIVDYGGIGPGCGGMVDSLCRVLIEIIESHPSCLVMLWTKMTVEQFYQEELEHLKAPNVLLPNKNGGANFGAAKKWLE